MANLHRGRMALQAWRDHLITAPEAMEISGVERESDLLAFGFSPDEKAGDREQTDQN